MSEDNRHNENPEMWCRAPLCKHTNWGGYDRLHLRGSDCPPYDENPAPNPSAEFWEDIRRGARQMSRHQRGPT